MPTVNTYFEDEKLVPQLDAITPELKEVVAEQLTCGDRALQPNEVTVRKLLSRGKGLMADVEMDIVAAPYKERVERQDEICRFIRRFVLDNLEGVNDVQVWLPLSELGHSMEESKDD
jgi:RecA-family ATPase